MAKKLNPADFKFSKRTGERLVKTSPAISGQQFILEDLTSCEVYLLDSIGCMTVDYCRDCILYIGPVSDSLFLRNCERVRVIAAAGQLRTRECVDCVISLYCPTEPVIELSTGLTFEPYSGAYPGLAAHFAAAQLLPHVNKWSKIYDFNADDETLPKPHYTIAPVASPPLWRLTADARPAPDSLLVDSPVAPVGEAPGSTRGALPTVLPAHAAASGAEESSAAAAAAAAGAPTSASHANANAAPSTRDEPPTSPHVVVAIDGGQVVADPDAGATAEPAAWSGWCTIL